MFSPSHQCCLQRLPRAPPLDDGESPAAANNYLLRGQIHFAMPLFRCFLHWLYVLSVGDVTTVLQCLSEMQNVNLACIRHRCLDFESW
jgi:hypothetical protein